MTTVRAERSGQRIGVTFLVAAMLGLPLTYLGTLYATQLANIAVACVLAVAAVWTGCKWASSARTTRGTALIVVAACPLALVYVVSLIANGAYTIDSLKTLAQLWLVVLFLCGCLELPRLDLSLFRRSVPVVTLLVFLPVAAAFIYVAKVVGDDGPSSLWTRAKNTVAAIALLLTILNYLIWQCSQRRRLSSVAALIACVVMFTCVYATGSRGAGLSLISMICVSVSWPYVRYKWAYLWVTFAVISIGIFIYIQLPNMSISSSFSDAMRQSTGENLYSGRELIWPSIVNSVSAHGLWLGLGPDATAEQAMLAYGIHRNWSAHNLYLQVLLQGGWSGVVALGLLLCAVWRVIRKVGQRTGQARFACAFFVGMLVYDTFEVTLLQNNLSTGLALWITLALVLHVSRQAEPVQRSSRFRRANFLIPVWRLRSGMTGDPLPDSGRQK